MKYIEVVSFINKILYNTCLPVVVAVVVVVVVAVSGIVPVCVM